MARSAAGMSYFLTLTVFPLLICLSAIADTLHLEDTQFLELLEQLVPESVVLVLSDYFGYISGNQSAALFAAGLMILITSSSAGFRALLRSTDDLYERRAYIGPWSFIISILCSAALLLTLYASVLVIVSGRWLLTFVEGIFPSLSFLGHWTWFRFVLLFALIFLALWLLFRLTAPASKPRLPVWKSAMGTAVILVAVSVLFSSFIGFSSRYSLVYGGLAAIIILMLWFYMIANVILAGAASCALRFRLGQGRYRPKKESGAVQLLRQPRKALRRYRERKAPPVSGSGGADRD